MNKLTFAILCLFVSSFAQAQTGPGMTYHGRLLKPNGEPVASVVNFKLQIVSPGSEQCVLWEETQTQDLSRTAGVFVLHLNSASSTRTDGGVSTFQEIFANRKVLTPAVGKCASGYSSFDPTLQPSAPRILRLAFNDGTFTGWEDSDDQAINYVPKAIDALQVSGFPASSLLRFADSSGALINTSPLSNAQYTELLALLGGTSTQYSKPGDQVSLARSAPGSLSAGSVWLDGSALKYYDGSTTQTLSTTATSSQRANGTGDISYAGRVGVGVTTPVAKFEVQGSTSDSSAQSVNVKNASGTSTFSVRNDGRIGIGTTSPSYHLSFGAEANRTIGVERMTTASSAGADLKISAGTATAAGSNLAGGDLYLSSGIGTGTSSSNLFFQTANRGATATGDGVPTTRMTIDTYGNVGIGNGPQSNNKIFVSAVRSNPAISYNGLRVQGDSQQNAGSSSQELNAVYAHNNPSTAASASLTGQLSGVLAESRVTLPAAAGTVQNAAAVRATYGITSTATGSPTTVNAYGIYIQPYHEAGTITNSYGIRIDAPSVGSPGGTVTNEYGLYQASATAKNYIAGNLGVGTSSPVAKLNVSGAIVSDLPSDNTSATIDWSRGNLQTTSVTTGSFTMTNMKSGGVYNLVVTTTANRTFSFAGTGLTFNTGTLSLTTSGTSKVIFTFLVTGSTVFVTMNQGY